MAETTPSNAWVDSYLNALLTTGLSSEYTGAPKSASDAKAPNADRSVFSRYYVRSLLQLDEEALKNAYLKAANSSRQGRDADQRLEFLTWRIWDMKRRQAAAARARAAAGGDENETAPPSRGDSSDEDGEEWRPRRRAAAAALGTLSRAAALVGAEPGAAPPAGAASPPPRGAPPPLRPLRTRPELLDAVLDAEALSPPAPPAPPPGAAGARLGRAYVVMISLHGLVRGDAMELGRDSDTGGQVKYVVELARAMAAHPAVHRVDLLTRLIADPKVDAAYAAPEERLARPPPDAAGRAAELGGAFIVRLPCGPRTKYVRKEALWPHVREFADRGVAHVRATLAALAEAGRRCELYAVHGHYADAGEAAALMAATLDAPVAVTGHSLGRNKLEHVLASGAMSRAEAEAAYALSRRIEAEERCLDAAALVFTSTQQEVDAQWGLYDGYDAELARALAARRPAGYHMPAMYVSPPGLDFSALKVDIPEDPVLAEFAAQRAALAERELAAPFSPAGGGGAAAGAAKELAAAAAAGGGGGGGGGDGAAAPPTPAARAPGASAAASPRADGASAAASPRADGDAGPGSPPPAGAAPFMTDAALDPTGLGGPPIWQDIARFLRNPLKPAILAMSRPDAKKNLTTLVQAFGEHPVLRQLANLVLVMGNRDTIDAMPAGSQAVLTQVLKLVDAYDLYGSVSYPKHHSQADISDIYLFAARTRGVFVNPALQEPFGLTVIEAAAHGVPTVATQNGGPVDIMATLRHGVTVDPTDAAAVAAALLRILTDPGRWDAMAAAGAANIMAYSWPAHCKRYFETFAPLRGGARAAGGGGAAAAAARRPSERGALALLMERSATLLEPGGGASAAASGRATPTGGATPGGGGTPAAAAPGAALMAAHVERHSSSPLPPGGAGPLSAPPAARRQVSGLSTDDLAVVGALAAEPSASALGARAGEAAAGRRRFAVLHLDSNACVPLVARLLADVVAALPDRGGAAGGADAGAATGVGLLSMLGFDSTCRSLEAEGADLAALDFVVCNAGADAWTRLDDGRWAADEAYEAAMELRWDRAALRRALEKIVSAPAPGAGRGRLPRIKELLYRAGEVPPAGVHPRHLVLELDADAQACLLRGAGPRARALEGVAAAAPAAERLRRRLRAKGLRAHATLQAVPRPAADGGGHTCILHVTPLRASRALALRFLADRWGLPLDAFALVAAPPEVRTLGGGGGGGGASPAAAAAAAADAAAAAVVGPYTSDAVDLLAGALRVVVLPSPLGDGGLAPPGGELARHLGVPLGPWAGCGRVALAAGAAELPALLAQALAEPAAGGGAGAGGDGSAEDMVG